MVSPTLICRRAIEIERLDSIGRDLRWLYYSILSFPNIAAASLGSLSRHIHFRSVMISLWAR